MMSRYFLLLAALFVVAHICAVSSAPSTLEDVPSESIAPVAPADLVSSADGDATTDTVVRDKRAPLKKLALLGGAALLGKKALVVGGAALGAKALVGAGLYKAKYYGGGYGHGYGGGYYGGGYGGGHYGGGYGGYPTHHHYHHYSAPSYVGYYHQPSSWGHSGWSGGSGWY